MYKQLRFLTTMLLLAVCCGTWAEEVAFTFATSKSSSNTAYATNYDITVNGMAWSCPGNQNFSGYVRIGGKSISTDVDRDIYSKVAMSDAISKITFNHNGISNKNLKVNKITLTVASDASFNNVVDTKVITPTFSVGTEGSFDFTPTSNNWAANSFYKFTINVTNTSSTNYGLDVKSIVFYKENGGSSLTQSDLDLTNAPVALNFDLYNNSSAQTISYTTSSTGAVTVSGGDGYVTTSVNATNKTITVTPTSVTPSAQTITVSQAADDYYNAGTATFTVSVTNSDPNVPGTQDNPYTVAQARAAIDAGVGVTGVYVTGIVCEGGSSLNSGAMNYWISDDGTETDKFEIYKGKGIDGANFTSTDDVQVGDVVVIYGNLKKYNSTYEFDANSQLVSLQRPEITTPSISLSETTIEATADETEGTINVTYTNFSDVIADVEFYEADGETTASYDWVTAEVNTDNNLDYVIDANSGEARTAYLKVWAYDDDFNEVYSELITITQDAYVAPVIPTGNSYVKVTSTDDITTGQYLIVYEGDENHSAVAFNGGLETLDAANNTIGVTIENNEIAATTATEAAEFTIDATDGTIKSASGYYIGQTSDANGMNTSTETAYTNTISIDDEGNAVILASGGAYLRYNSASNQERFRYYKSTSYTNQKAIQLYKKSQAAASTATITLNAACHDADGMVYGTYSNTSAFVVSADITVAEVGIVDGQLLVDEYETGAVVPANTGVMVSAMEGGDYTVTLTDEEGTSVLGNDNMLRATGAEGITAEAMGAAEDADCLYYRLTMHNGTQIGFWWGADEGAAFDVAANKAYLAVPANQSKNGFAFGNDGDATSISTIDNGQLTMDNANHLQGHKVGSEYKGIVIVNGKKVMVK